MYLRKHCDVLYYYYFSDKGAFEKLSQHFLMLNYELLNTN